MRMLLLVPVVLAGLSVAGCGDQDTAPDPRPAAEATAEDSPVRVVAEEQADLVLWVSNQSFEDATVHLTVEVDGVTVVDAPFDVEGQHNWIKFPLAMPPGEHTLTARSDTGTTHEQTFRLPRDGRRYAVLDYWNYDDREGRHFTWMIQRRPVAFA